MSEGGTEPIIRIEGLDKWFGHFQVLTDINLVVLPGERIVICGPSGSGKSTLIRCINRLETAQKGRIVVDGVDLAAGRRNVDAVRREVGMVFQQFNLFPHLTVLQNCTLAPMRSRGMSKAQAEEVAMKYLTRVRIPDQAHKYPSQLSGGQQQRIALARAIAPKPKLLLLDEPLSALDAKVRVSLREEIRSIQKKLGITTIFVTHDQEEALSISDRIAVMYGGKAEQVGTPFEIYNRPSTRFVANFVGTLNVLEGTVSDAASGKVRINTEEIALKNKLNGSRTGETLSLALRPEAIALGRRAGHDANLSGEIAEVHFLGSVIRVRVGLGNSTVSLDTFNNSSTPPPTVGQRTEISFASEDVLVLH